MKWGLVALLLILPIVNAGWGEFQYDNDNSGNPRNTGTLTQINFSSITINEGMSYQPLVADLDDNGDNEVVLFVGSRLKVYNENLVLQDSIDVGILRGQPSIFNIDSDAYNEIVFVARVGSTDYVMMYEYNGNFLAELNISIPNGGQGTGVKCVNADPKICVMMDNKQYIHVVYPENKTEDLPYNISVFNDTLEKIPALGDIDNDGNIEAVFWFDENNDDEYGFLVFDIENKKLNINFGNSSGIVDDIMVPTGVNSGQMELRGHPVLVDLNDDGILEVASSVFYNDKAPFFETEDWFTELIVSSSNGSQLFRKCELGFTTCNDGSSLLAKWRGSNPFVMDADLNGMDDVCFIKDQKVFAAFTNMGIACFNYSGAYVLDSNISAAHGDTLKFATAADMNNDGISEILTENRIYARNGSSLFSYIHLNGYAVPVDVNLDGLMDFIVSQAANTTIYYNNQAVEEESLLEKYAPVLYFHPDEQFFPTSIEAMLNESDLRENDLVFDDLIDELPVDVNNLNGSEVTDDFYLDMRNASGGFTNFEIPNPNRFLQYPKTVYGREFNPDAEHIVLQYWFFYLFNNWSNKHEGDWEMIQVIFDNDSKPITSTFSYHHDAQTLFWNETEKSDETHPNVYIALGGHASYWRLENRTYRTITENLSNEGITLFPKSDYLLREIDNFTTWAHYLGLWGEKLLGFGVSGPNSPANLMYPGQENRWDNSLEFAKDSRSDETTAITGSPVNLHAYDRFGNHVGLNKSGDIEIEIPNTYLYIPSNNNKELIEILENEEISYFIEGTDIGTFNLTIIQFDSETKSEINLTYQDVSVNESTLAYVNLSETNPNYIMKIDSNLDGIIDTTQSPNIFIIDGNKTNLESDSDNDGFSDSIDNCPQLYNPNQETDLDLDGFDNLLCSGNDCDDDSPLINPDAQESCNNFDDNCNNEIDEGLTRVCGLTDVGICAFGEEECISGNWENCEAVFPEIELCNSLDDDCNFNIDDGFNISDACSVGVGECKVEGFYICSSDNQSSVCNAVVGNSKAEICDNKDNNCDGEIDNNCAISNKLEAIFILNGEITGSCPVKGICKDQIIEQVVEYIEKSVRGYYFLDNETLSELGINVFNYESSAVKICDQMKEKTDLEEACNVAISLMKAADKHFAEKALGDAKSLIVQNPLNQPCYDKKTGTAELYIRNAEDFFTKYFPNKVIDRYGLAWKNAQEAVKFATASKDIC